MLTDASIYDDNMTLLQAYKSLEKRVKALEAGGGGGGSYILPTASETVKGGVKIGSGLQMDGEVLSTTGGGGGGGSEVNAQNYTLENAKGSGDNSGFLMGFVESTDIPYLPIDQGFVTPLTFVNKSDSSDTKTLYIENATKQARRKFYFSKENVPILFNNGGMIQNVNNETTELNIPYSEDNAQLYVYDSASQGEAEAVGVVTGTFSDQNKIGEVYPITWSMVYPYGCRISGTLSNLTCTIYDEATETEKTYTCDSEIDFSKVYGTGDLDAQIETLALVKS